MESRECLKELSAKMYQKIRVSWRFWRMSIDFRRDLIWALPEKQTLIESQQDDDEILSQAADWLTHLILRTGERKDAMHCTPERCFSFHY